MESPLARVGRKYLLAIAVSLLGVACRDASGPGVDPAEQQRALWRRWVSSSVFTYDSLNAEGSLCTVRGTEPVFEPNDVRASGFVCGELFFFFPGGTAREQLNAIAASASAEIRRVSPGVPGAVDGYAYVKVPPKTEKQALLRFLQSATTTQVGINVILIIE